MFMWPGVARRRRAALGGGALFCAALGWSPADAENNDVVKIEVDFDACVILKGQDRGRCSNEQWNIEVNEHGWSASGRAFDGIKPISEMSATCKDGAYEGIADGYPWSAKCALTGGATHPCFHINGGGPDQSFSKIAMRQCFEIVGSACSMEMEGEFTGQVEPAKGEYALALKELKRCRIVD